MRKRAGLFVADNGGRSLRAEEGAAQRGGRKARAQPLFKLAQAFRAGIEGAISVLKRVFGLRRCLREGWAHFQSWVGVGVLVHNLVLLART